MNRFTSHFKRHATAALAADERARMRARLERAMSERPALTPSPYASRFAFPYFVFSQRFAYALAAVLILVGITGSTAYAAEGTIPGDLLYSVKVNVNEPVALALAVTPQSKADTHAAIATARLAEAQALAAQGSLTASTSDELADSFTTNVSAASAIADSVATTSPDIAIAIRTNLSDTVASGASALLDEGDRQGDGVQVATGAFVRRALRLAIADDARHSATTTRAIAIAAQTPGITATQATPSEGVRPRAALMKAAVPVATEPSGTAVATFSVALNPSAQATDAATPAPALATAPFDAQAFDRAFARAVAKFNEASSTLDASTTAAVQSALSDARLVSVSIHADASVGADADARGDYASGFGALARAELLLRAAE